MVDAGAAVSDGKGGEKPEFKIPPKKPKLSKAERRALQEKQRAEKAARAAAGGGGKKGGGGSSNHKKGAASGAKKEGSTGGDGGGGGVDSKKETRNDREEKKKDGGASQQQQRLFSHLPRFRDRSGDPHLSGVALRSDDKSLRVELHPAVLALGVKYADGTIRGANARCRAMMECFRTVVSDYVPPPPSSSSRDDAMSVPAQIDQRILRPSFQHWTANCRPHSVTMGNAFAFLKTAAAALPRDCDLAAARAEIVDRLDAYVQERVDFAGRVISRHVRSKIADGDVLLVHGRSEVVVASLLEARRAGRVFRVVVADARPTLEGRRALRELTAAGVSCTYVSSSSASYAIASRGVDLCLLGAAALTSDGSVTSRVGTAGVAAAARAARVPVLVCCETYKIHDRVRLESSVINERGDPGELSWNDDDDDDEKHDDDDDVLHVLYDTTPSSFVDGIVTEVGILPPTSVAVLLREMTNGGGGGGGGGSGRS